MDEKELSNGSGNGRYQIRMRRPYSPNPNPGPFKIESTEKDLAHSSIRIKNLCESVWRDMKRTLNAF